MCSESNATTYISEKSWISPQILFHIAHNHIFVKIVVKIDLQQQKNLGWYQNLVALARHLHHLGGR